eukprot:scaffold3965_cov414-Prasinococcus_capsulatus_cf.AAC.2
MTREVVVAAPAVDAPLVAWDLESGAQLRTYKGTTVASGSLCPLGDQCFIASQAQKSGVFSWDFASEQVQNKIPLTNEWRGIQSFPAEIVGPLATTRNSEWTAAGGASGKVYLWQATTGRLVKFFPAHYKKVRSLTFSSCGSFLLTGGEDGIIHTWCLMTVLGGNVRPYKTMSNHSLAVTDLQCGHGSSDAMFVSVSLDRSCRLWSLASGALLRTVILPVQLVTVLMDVGECGVFAGGENGRICAISVPQLGLCGSEIVAGFDEAVDGEGGSTDNCVTLLRGHTQRITGLGLSVEVCLFARGTHTRFRDFDFERECAATGEPPCFQFPGLHWVQVPFSSLLMMPQYARWTPLEQSGSGRCFNSRRKGHEFPVGLSKYEATSEDRRETKVPATTTGVSRGAIAMAVAQGRVSAPTRWVDGCASRKSTQDALGSYAEGAHDVLSGPELVPRSQNVRHEDIGEDADLRRQLAQAQESVEHFKKLHSDLFNECLKKNGQERA